MNKITNNQIYAVLSEIRAEYACAAKYNEIKKLANPGTPMPSGLVLPDMPIQKLKTRLDAIETIASTEHFKIGSESFEEVYMILAKKMYLCDTLASMYQRYVVPYGNPVYDECLDRAVAETKNELKKINACTVIVQNAERDQFICDCLKRMIDNSTAYLAELKEKLHLCADVDKIDESSIIIRTLRKKISEKESALAHYNILLSEMTA